MEHLLVELARATGEGGFLHLATSLVMVGVILIAINLASHALIEKLRTRAERFDAVAKALKPVTSSAADLVSRLSEILLTHERSMVDAIESYDPETAVLERMPTLTPITMNRHESTAFRLVRFLSFAEQFRRDTAEIPAFGLIEEAEYYLQHKIRVALKGNLYGSTFLSTELQEEIGVTLLPQNLTERRTDVGQLCHVLRAHEYFRQLFRAALDGFRCDVAPLRKPSEIDRRDHNWRRILTLAQLGIYLIDFFQHFSNTSQWEEQRLFFVRLIEHWNMDANKQRYVYEPGDLSTGNYLDSYPGRITPAGAAQNMVTKVLELMGMRRWLDRRAKSIHLNSRGRRFRRRHDTKRIRKWGVEVKTRDGWRSFRVTDDVYTLLNSLQEILKIRAAVGAS
jgi:hypothetical protein